MGSQDDDPQPRIERNRTMRPATEVDIPTGTYFM